MDLDSIMPSEEREWQILCGITWIYVESKKYSKLVSKTKKK